jgi:ABC-type phosphate transport system substrate-binding protein
MLRWPAFPWRPLAAVLVSAAAHAGSAEPPIAVVVGRASPSVVPLPLSTSQVYAIYARKRLLWPDRSPVLAVNLPASHPLRRSFSWGLFRHSPEDLQDYWNDAYFHGLLPPPVLGSEEAVLRFVAATPGAIGYVSLCLVDKRVEVAALIASPDGTAPCPHGQGQ